MNTLGKLAVCTILLIGLGVPSCSRELYSKADLNERPDAQTGGDAGTPCPWQRFDAGTGSAEPGSAGDAGVHDAQSNAVGEITCPSRATDRTGALEIGFRNTGTVTLYLASLDNLGKIMLVINTSYYFPRGVCDCGYAARLLSIGSCRAFCDLGHFVGGIPWEFSPNTSHVSSISSGGGADGYNSFICSYGCLDDLSPHDYIDASCWKDIPIPSGQYKVAFCASRKPAAFSSTLFFRTEDADSEFCPDGYEKLVRTICVGPEDVQVTVDFGEMDLQ